MGYISEVRVKRNIMPVSCDWRILIYFTSALDDNRFVGSKKEIANFVPNLRVRMLMKGAVMIFKSSSFKLSKYFKINFQFVVSFLLFLFLQSFGCCSVPVLSFPFFPF